MDERQRADAIKDLDTLAVGLMADLTQSARLAWEAGQKEGEELEAMSQWDRFTAALEQLEKITSVQKRLKENPGSVTEAELDVLPSVSGKTPGPQVAPEAGIIRCRYCGAPYAYRENLELHERGCPKRG